MSQAWIITIHFACYQSAAVQLPLKAHLEASIAEMMVMAGFTSIDRNTIVMLLSGDNGVIDWFDWSSDL
jgi:hypothetical protein